MAEKVTLMILKVDLQCPSCYKKVKKILCKFPEIRDQVYDEKQNLVKITVVSCCPEKIRDKICCKGRKVIKSIEIVEPPKPKPKEPEKPKQPEKPKEAEKPKQPDKPKEVEKPKKPETKPPEEKPKDETPKKPPPAQPEPVPAGPWPYPWPWPYPPVPPGYWCVPCSKGCGEGQCYCGFRRPVEPPPWYYNYGYGYGYGKGCYTSRCDYFSEENTGGCTIV